MAPGLSDANQTTAAETSEDDRASNLMSEDNNKRAREGDEPNPGKRPKAIVFPTTRRPGFNETPMEAVRRFATTRSSNVEPWQLHSAFQHAGWLSGVIPELMYNPIINRDSMVSLQRRLMAISNQVNPPSSFVGFDPYFHVLPSLSTMDTRMLRHQPFLASSPLVAADPFYSILLSTLQDNGATNGVVGSPFVPQLSLLAQASVQQAANRGVLRGSFIAPAHHNEHGYVSRLQRDEANQVSSKPPSTVSKRHHKRTKQESAPKPGLTLYVPEDRENLSEHQMFLRLQIEYFRASQHDIMSITRGKNKPITLMQVGIRCRHCSHVAAGRRKKGSTYFPSNIMGIYQACQNLGVEHLQSGLCTDAPPEVIERLIQLGSTKHGASGVGKKYWADKAERLGLIDTDEGIRFAADLL